MADDLDPAAVERAALVRLLEPGIGGTWLTPSAARRVQAALAARQPAPTVSAEQVEGIVRRVQEQRFTDDEGHDVGTMRPIEARTAVVHTLGALGIEVQDRG